MSLVDALIEFGVPDPSNLEDLLAFGDDLYKRIELADLNDTEPVALAARDHAPEFIALAEAASRAEDPRAHQLLDAVAGALPLLRNLVFLDAADVALSSPNLMKRHALGRWQGRSLSGLMRRALMTAYRPMPIWRLSRDWASPKTLRGSER